MKFLFVHQNFPGQYLHIVRRLLDEGGHEIVFMTEPNRNVIAGVRKVTYARPPLLNPGVHPDAREFDQAMRRAAAALAGARQIKALGYQPDIIIGHHGWGELLSLPDIFPAVPILGYFEFFYRTEGADVNYDPEFPAARERYIAVHAKNGVNQLALGLGQHGQTPTRWQHETYPAWARRQISVIEEGVDLALCAPDPRARRRAQTIGTLSVSPQQKLITYVARNLEPYRGFHSFMRALPAIQKARPDAIVAIVGGDEISYGAAHPKGPWRKVLLDELAGTLDLARIHFLGQVPYDTHRALLRRSDAHVYLTYPFVASWSLREALATGCVIVGGDTPTVREFVADRQTGVIVQTLDPASIASGVLEALEDRGLAERLRAGARAFAERHLDLDVYLRSYRAEIDRILDAPAPLPRGSLPGIRKSWDQAAPAPGMTCAAAIASSTSRRRSLPK
jgi:glycosyltransferase involved in cell wall biosynthesis